MPIVEAPPGRPPLPVPELNSSPLTFDEEFTCVLDLDIPVPPKIRQKPLYWRESTRGRIKLSATGPV